MRNQFTTINEIRPLTMAQEGMAAKCILTFQYKYLTLIQLGQVGGLMTATPLSRNRSTPLKNNTET